MAEIAAAIGPVEAVVEFGAGSQTKTPLLLRALAPEGLCPDRHQRRVSRRTAPRPSTTIHARIDVFPVVADFTQPFDLPAEVEGMPRLGFFPGSTIGNFVPRSATDLLRHFRDILGTGSKLLIGMDRVKPVERLIAAYDDPEGVTAEFNLNLLHRINRELGADIPLDAFAHEARWNDMLSRIEMHLRRHARRRLRHRRPRIRLPRGRDHPHREQPQIWAARRPHAAARRRLDARSREWTDAGGRFRVILAEAQPNRFAP